MKSSVAVLPPFLVLDQLLQSWLLEDIGRGDRTTQSLLSQNSTKGQAKWIAKAPGIIAGLPVAARVFQLLNNQVNLINVTEEGTLCKPGQVIAEINGSLDALLMGERVALNLTMRLSGIASLTSLYVEKIADLPTQLVDTRKTTPGLRILEKYATALGGAINHRMGLDDAVMIKDNHILAAGGIREAITRVRSHIPYPLTIEVETESLEQVQEALNYKADIIMLDNMSLETMSQAVSLIRQEDSRVKIEASGNITLETIRAVAKTGVDYISTSAPITQSKWLDISMRIVQ
ncbi:carboxylating nicotinate-nucleotide diphosphorylase [Aphanizomenon flos-aquae NRERC-008]|jgi:nicotinate-nucleotide pyrophosphorylase (carboxylating)|uniref:nicotinate-nucleotide diphosphorylase (carboxylating) n=2 Tax=Aphanizomenon flos-aquae TaxID=1176 RepID=A0ABR8IRW7_APHFL|nr:MULTISPECIES: carboxylating nicotinate-nucleotide diphosphorylase [Aphanizomenon]MBD2390636.1 carboxylating nicotinate-nucleotide diphosphorylase [Aphanizomenon flos-aquae FACHB-1171]MBD2557611.1 carboxylating nicotinate-nucleotide diphosphorylase [Aphanizomenon flos-aquae FACHB-1290]MBD2632048.1 carboxylating nicotinate-nucleotide diphosphorylase [Aphanizomenon sp. FACHB-1399]MBD2642841.1 carboxylating nicotinate-nucleotide diphosphorylase [Aphanizomenon sp. FACHB-1401]MBD2657432.1 carboxy